MEDLDALWERYREAVRAGGNPQALYQEMVWPALLALWREKPRVYPFPQAFAVSVHTLGTSPEATALAILGAGAERVYVLHTPESARFLPRLRQDTGKDLYPVEIGKSDGPTSVAASLGTLIFGFALLLVLSLVTRRRRRDRRSG